MSMHRSYCFLLGLGVVLSSFCLAQTRGPGRVAGSPTSGSAGTQRSNTPSGLGSHSANDEGKLEFRTQATLVQVPVVVTDKAGSHIHGLTKDDFQVLENGKEQKLATFEELTATNSKLPAVALKPGQFGNLSLSDQQPRTVTVIALDTVNTPFLDQTYGRRQLVKYLASSVEPGQVLALMIITSHGLRIVQGLTGDSEHLLQVLKKVTGAMPDMQSVDIDAQADAAAGDTPDIPSISTDPTAAIDAFVERGDAIYAQFQQQNAIETTLNSFQAIAWSLSGIPGRKALIWATGGFPFAIGSPDAVPGGYLSTLYERTMNALSAAQISVYPVDVRGLVYASPMGDASKSRMPTTRQMNNRAWLQQSTLDTLNEFADMTGGKAFYNTNDLAGSFRRAADDASSYYLIGYYLDAKNDKAGWRSLKVKVDKKNTEVRARKGFFVTNATLHAESNRNAELFYALGTPIEGTGVPIVVEWTGVTGDGDKKKAAFLAHVPSNALSFDPAVANKLDFDFAIVAFAEKDGKQAAHFNFNFSKPIPDAQLAAWQTNGLGVRNALELASGKYVVRFVVRDNITGKVGSVTAPLTVN